MANDATAPGGRAMGALRDARALYRRLSEALMAELRALGREAAGVGEVKEFTALLGAHQKALSTLLEFEARVEKQITERIGRGRGELDVAAARDEILGRLDRLAAQG